MTACTCSPTGQFTLMIWPTLRLRLTGTLLIGQHICCNHIPRLPHAQTYGDIADWDISPLTDLSYVFCGYSNSYNTDRGCRAAMRSFNADISRWDTSRVTTFECKHRFRLQALVVASRLRCWTKTSRP